jgi:uncharacterized protein YjiS (DUF1127 family)
MTDAYWPESEMIAQAPQHREQYLSKPVVANDLAARTALDAQDHRDRWHRLLDTLFQARLRSAQREIARHEDAIVLWRRRLAQRGAHLRTVTAGNAAVADAAVSPATVQPFEKFCGRLGAVFANMPAIVAQCRRRVRLRGELLALSDNELRDIRWTRAEAEAQARKPFWRD